MQQTNEATKFKHSHSVPVQKRKEMLNPLIFKRLSRSNVNDVCLEEETRTDETDDRNRSSNSGNDRSSSSNSSSSSPSIWTVGEMDEIEKISPFFHLQPTHCVIYDLSPKTIAKNISEYLDEITVSKLFDDKHAMAHAELEDGLRIIIHIFKTNEEIVEHGEKEGILVEVSRRDGCSAKYHSVAMKILCAAKGLDRESWNIDDNTRSTSRGALPLKGVPSQLRKAYMDQMKLT
jgi:hypothetical protein